jgi:hypothetical protein
MQFHSKMHGPYNIKLICESCLWSAFCHIDCSVINRLISEVKCNTGRDSVVRTVIRLQNGRSGVPILAGARICSLFQNIQTNCGVQTGTWSTGTRDPGCELDHSFPSTHPLYLHVVDTENLIYTFTWIVIHTYIRFRKNGELNVTDLSCLQEQSRY